MGITGISPIAGIAIYVISRGPVGKTIEQLLSEMAPAGGGAGV